MRGATQAHTTKPGQDVQAERETERERKRREDTNLTDMVGNRLAADLFTDKA